MSAIAVVGGANVDICGYSENPVIGRDSNPGRVVRSAGGVGRNIAASLAALGEKVSLISAFGSDNDGDFLKARCGAEGVDVSRSLTFPGESTSCYLCAHDSTGEMLLAINDMAVTNRLTPDALKQHKEFLNSSDMVVIDANLPESTIGWIAGNVSVPIAADPVSVNKCGKLAPYLGVLSLFKPNLMEARAITATRDGAVSDISSRLIKAGVKMPLISLAESGAYYESPLERGLMKCYNGEVKSVTGCGDAFLAAAAQGYLRGLSARECVKRALAAAALRAAGLPLSDGAVMLVIEKGGVFQ